LKPERWGSPLVQEKYREEKACDKRHPYRIIIIIIIIIIYLEHHTEHGKYCSLKLDPEQWGSPVVQEKYQDEKACDERRNNNNNNNNNNTCRLVGNCIGD